MKILFVGESWLGSCARSMKEALVRLSNVELDEISEDAAFPKPVALWLKVLAKVTYRANQRELSAAIIKKIQAFKPDAVLVYKGWNIKAGLFDATNKIGIPVINIYPDNSPHAHGANHRLAVGRYDAVISSKAYHPELWRAAYGYTNPCHFVPQGYDPYLSLHANPVNAYKVDVVLAATYRTEYGDLMRALAAQLPDNISVAIAGNGWTAITTQLPKHWRFVGALHGRSYTEFLRSGRIVIAPMSTQSLVSCTPQPGDVDTTRTYELAAAHCFFIHRHSDYLREIYSEQEVPSFTDGNDLAEQILYYLARPELRQQMALAAHQRAVPAYSLDARAQDILAIVQTYVHHKKHNETVATPAVRE